MNGVFWAMGGFTREDANSIAAVSSMIIALLALVISIVELRADRKFEALKWQPDLQVAIGKSDAERFEIQIGNDGLGPARLKWIDIYLHEKPIDSLAHIYDYVVNRAIPDGGILRSPNARYQLLSPNSILAAGETHALLSERSKDWVEMLHDDMQAISIAVCYCSLLNNCTLEKWTPIQQLEARPTCDADQTYAFGIVESQDPEFVEYLRVHTSDD